MSAPWILANSVRYTPSPHSTVIALVSSIPYQNKSPFWLPQKTVSNLLSLEERTKLDLRGIEDPDLNGLVICWRILSLTNRIPCNFFLLSCPETTKLQRPGVLKNVTGKDLHRRHGAKRDFPSNVKVTYMKSARISPEVTWKEEEMEYSSSVVQHSVR